MAKLKNLDQVLQAWTPVQTYSDSDGLEEYLRNLVSQTKMTTSEFKTISQLKNQLEVRVGELQNHLTLATARIEALQAEKDASLKEPQEFSLAGLLQQLQEKIKTTTLTTQDDATRHSLAELAAQVTQGLGHNELEEKARDAAQALKEARDQLDSLSQAHQTTLTEVDALRQKADKVDQLTEQLNLLQSKYNDLCQFCPNSADPVPSLRSHLQSFKDGQCVLEKKISVQNGIVASLKQALDVKAEQVAALTKRVETLQATASQETPQGAFQTNGAAKSSTGKKKRGAAASNPPRTTNTTQPTQAAVDPEAANDLLAVVEEKKRDLEAVKNDLSLTTRELEAAKSQLATAQTQLDAQTLAFEETNAKLLDLNSRYRELELRHSEAIHELEFHRVVEAELNEQLKASESQVASLAQLVESATSLEAQVSDLKSQLERSQSDAKQQHEAGKQLSQKVAELESEMAAKEAALFDSKRQWAQIEKEKEALTAEHLTLQTQMESTVALSKRMEEEKTAQQVELKALKHESEAYQTKLAKAEAERSNLLTQVETLRNTIEGNKALTRTLSEENVRLKTLADLAAKDKTEAQKEVEGSIRLAKELQQELDGLKERCKILDQELQTSRQLFKDKATRLDALHLQHVQLQASSAEEAAKLQDELQVYKDRHLQAQKELEAHQASTSDQIKRLQDQLTETQKRIEESTATIQELNHSIQSSSKEHLEMKLNLARLLATNQSYELELNDARERLKNLDRVEEESQRILLERDDLIEQAKLRESHLRNLNRDLKEEVKRLQRPTGTTMGTPPLSPTDPRLNSDHPEHVEQGAFNLEYLRNIIFKFLADKDHRPQLITVLSHLLKFSPAETRKLMETIRT